MRSPGYPARTSGKNTPRWRQGPDARLFLRPGRVSACGAGCCCGWPGQPDARQVLLPYGRPPHPRFHAQLRGFCRGRIAAPPKRDGLPGWALIWEALCPAAQNAGHSWPCRWPRHRPFLSQQHAFSGWHHGLHPACQLSYLLCGYRAANPARPVLPRSVGAGRMAGARRRPPRQRWPLPALRTF